MKKIIFLLVICFSISCKAKGGKNSSNNSLDSKINFMATLIKKSLNKMDYSIIKPHIMTSKEANKILRKQLSPGILETATKMWWNKWEKLAKQGYIVGKISVSKIKNAPAGKEFKKAFIVAPLRLTINKENTPAFVWDVDLIKIDKNWKISVE